MDFFSDIGTGISNIFTGIGQGINSALSPITQGVSGIVQPIIQPISQVAGSVGQGAASFINTGFNTGSQISQAIGGTATGVGNFLSSPFSYLLIGRESTLNTMKIKLYCVNPLDLFSPNY